MHVASAGPRGSGSSAMSELLEVLDAHQAAICPALADKLQRAGCATLASTRTGEPAAMLAALRACRGAGGQPAARAWAEALRREGLPLGLGCAEVLAALHFLERSVRLFAGKSLRQKKALLTALAEASSAVERLRRAYVDVPQGETSADARGIPDFLAVAASSGSFICLTTLHGRPLYLNPVARRLLGLSEDEPLTATSLHPYYTDESWAELRDVAVPAVSETGRWEGSSRLRNCQSGEVFDMRTSMYLVKRAKTEKPSCLALVHHEPAEGGQLAQHLAESEARKRAILESSLDPIITINHDGVITEFNRAAEQVFGHPREKVLGTKPSDVLFPPGKSAGHQNRIDRYLEVGEGSMLGKRIEVTALRANGETFAAEMAMTMSRERGAPVLTFFVRDISQRKKAEREQAHYAAELERSNRELEQFAYVASHDLQEPLRKIRTFGDRLEMKCKPQLDEVGQDCIERMQSAAARMQHLIEGLLALSRVTTKLREFAPVDLAKVAQEVVSDLEVRIEKVGGRVELGGLPTIQADAVQMRQLLQNLIGNALKFHREDEPPLVKVSGRFVQGRDQRGSGPQSAAEEQCRIVVEDNGIGFDEKHQERIFGVFQRLHPRDVYEGTGIGLAICRRIAELHGGSITARSAPDRGATFEVLLPVLQPKRREGVSDDQA
jgi:two-component system sensor kinase FixL